MIGRESAKISDLIPRNRPAELDLTPGNRINRAEQREGVEEWVEGWRGSPRAVVTQGVLRGLTHLSR